MISEEYRNKMNETIKKYLTFNIYGIDENLVSEEDIKLINFLEHKLLFLRSNCEPNDLILECYSLDKQLEIFNGLKERQGEKTRITFYNSRNIPVEIIKAHKREKEEIILECIFCKTRKYFRMRLSTFIKEYKEDKITRVKPDGFVNAYLVNAKNYSLEISDKLKALKDKYNKLYTERKNLLQASYDAEISKYKKIEKEGRNEKRQLTSEEALMKAKSFKGLDRIKNYWNTQVSQEEKDILLKWISENVYSIRVYGLINGRSGNVLSNEYSDIGEVKYRDIKTNDEGKVTSQDSIVAHISFKQVVDAPMEIFKKVVSTKGKRRSETIFRNNRLNDKNLALFLLSEYHDKGFKAGVRNLFQNVRL